ncbi:MAG: SDR family oxidoreductase [Chrysiogenetes bacterium]|nr:SDR family oxidoreductase [Chrysiogenetes bacterium]
MADWALILGASSGFGEAIGLELASKGFNIFGVHLDRKATLPNAERIEKEMQDKGVKTKFFNVNAADPEKIADVLDTIKGTIGSGEQVRVMLHSIAFGTLKPLVDVANPEKQDQISKPQLDMTVDVMANSLIYWAQGVIARDLMREHGRIYAMTSSGGTRVWPKYGAVSAAKAALESHCRQLALELAPRTIAVNAVRAGVTDTPALRKIPGSDEMINIAKSRNPYGRLTTPQDVAKCIGALVDPATDWLTGNTLGVDGGEDVIG